MAQSAYIRLDSIDPVGGGSATCRYLLNVTFSGDQLSGTQPVLAEVAAHSNSSTINDAAKAAAVDLAASQGVSLDLNDVYHMDFCIN